MPIIVAGGDADSASQRVLAVFRLCALLDKRDQSRKQLNVISFSIFCCGMAGLATNVSLGCAIALLCISVCFMLYSLNYESRVLRHVQRELSALLRDKPQSDIGAFFSEAVRDLHED